MLIITMHLNNPDGRSQYIWHIGERFPNADPEYVRDICVDGDELERLEEIYPGPIHTNHGVFTVSGSDAQYMVEGLKAFSK